MIRITNFDATQREAIRRAIRSQLQRRRLPRTRQHERQHENLYRDARMAIVTAEITARSGATLGRGTVRLQQLNSGGSLEAVGADATETAYSISASVITVGSYVFVVQDHSGRYLAIPFC